MMELILQILDALDRKQIRYCLLRDGDQLDRLAEGGEVDLLVQHGQLAPLQSVLSRFGLIRMRTWGQWPHHAFAVYHQASGGWLKFDVVTELAYGDPTRALRAPLAEGCLWRRRRHGPAWIPSAEDELLTLLLHCVLDKHTFASTRRRRLKLLCSQVNDPPYLGQLLQTYWLPGTTWSRIGAVIISDNWPAMLAEGKRVATRLARRDRLGTFGRRLRDRMLRKLGRCCRIVRPRTPLVAVLAPDGAGKSTLIAAIRKSFYFPVRSVPMGLYQKREARRKRMPVPGVGLTVRLLTQWLHYLIARYHQARGRLVLFDRYPYDALLPPAEPLGTWRRWRRQLLGRTCPAPDLVVVLDAPGEVLFARKGEHDAAALERQRRGYLALRARLPRVLVVDATRDAEHVCRQVTAAIWRHCTTLTA